MRQIEGLTPLSLTAQCLAVWGVAVAQPLYDLLSRSPEFLVAHGVTPIGLLGFAFVLSVMIPGALAVLLSFILRIRSDLGSALHAGVIWLGVSAFALQVYCSVGVLDGWLGVAFAAATGSAALASYLRWPGVRSGTTILAVGALVFPLLLAWRAPLGSLVALSAESLIANPAPRNPVSVVLVVLDEFPVVSLLDQNDEIDRSLFPSLARFADGAHWYRNTVAASDFTDRAVPAVVTGRLGDKGRLGTSFRTEPHNLFSLLGASHEIFASETMTQMCPPALCQPGSDHESGLDLRMLSKDLALIYGHLLLPMPLRSRIPELGTRWKGFGEGGASEAPRAMEPGEREPPELKAGFGRGEQARALVGSFREQLDTPGGDRPQLFFLHLMLPHQPWRFLPSGRSYLPYDLGRPRGKLRGGPWANDDWVVSQAQQRHLLQAVYTDALVGELLGQMNRANVYHDALIVITADHGISFLPGEPARTLSVENAAEVLFVPLLIKLPGQIDGVVEETPASTLDILPTIASVLECGIPWPTDGRSLIEPTQPPRASFPHVDGRRPLIGPDFDALLAQRSTRVEAKQAVFGSGRGPSKLIRIGSHQSLLGQRPRDFPRDQSAAEWVAWIPLVRELEDFDARADIIPLLVDGRLTGPGTSRAEIPLAVSLNGKVEALTRTFGESGYFTAMLPESALQPGRNRLKIHHIVSLPDGIALAPIRVPKEPPPR